MLFTPRKVNRDGLNSLSKDQKIQNANLLINLNLTTHSTGSHYVSKYNTHCICGAVFAHYKCTSSAYLLA